MPRSLNRGRRRKRPSSNAWNFGKTTGPLPPRCSVMRPKKNGASTRRVASFSLDKETVKQLRAMQVIASEQLRRPVSLSSIVETAIRILASQSNKELILKLKIRPQYREEPQVWVDPETGKPVE